MSIISAFHRHSAAAIFDAEATASVEAHLPSKVPCPYCGGPNYLGGGHDPTCVHCVDGYVVQWVISYAIARVMWVVPGATRWTRDGVFMTGEVGDLSLQVPMKYRHIFEKARMDPHAYLIVDGKRVRVTSVTQNRLDGPTTLEVKCHLVQDER